MGILIQHKKTDATGKWLWPLIVPISSMLIGFMAIGMCKVVFFAGRDAACRGLDHDSLYKVCRSLADSRDPSAEDDYLDPTSGAYNNLPHEILALSPLHVAISARAVVLMLDGGGPMVHEGIVYVFLDRFPECEKVMTSDTYTRVSETVPVYLYRLYDYRKILEDLHETASIKQ